MTFSWNYFNSAFQLRFSCSHFNWTFQLRFSWSNLSSTFQLRFSWINFHLTFQLGFSWSDFNSTFQLRFGWSNFNSTFQVRFSWSNFNSAFELRFAVNYFNIWTGSKFSTLCRVDKNYIIRKSSKYWTRISNFLEDVCPSPRQSFFKIDSPAEIARIFRSLSFSERSIYFFSFFLSAFDKDKRNTNSDSVIK